MDTIIELLGYVVMIEVCVGLNGRHRVTVAHPSGRVVADFSWPASPLSAAFAARIATIKDAGVPVYSVELWGSHPDDDNDDCWEGEDFESLAQAQACLENPWATFDAGYSCPRSVAFFVLDGPGVHQVRANPLFKKSSKRDDDDLWRQEIAHQAGMGLGIDAYNEAMGYDVSEYEMEW